MKKATLHTDGASLGNPGAAGIGVLIEIGGRAVEISEHIGTATNNVAEYAALVRGLREAKRLGVSEVAAFLDSELLVRQMTGRYKVRNPSLMPYYEEAKSIASSFRRFSITHIPREKNKRADQLSKDGAYGRTPKRPAAGPAAPPEDPPTGGQGSLPFH